tara:strand:+ start:130 stop:351 length:222 start_codon:yes stop_codon:yes gene_type:complete
MAFKGTAGKSASGASMSKYDVEVAAALKKINSRLDALEAQAHEKCEPTSTGGGDVGAVVAALKREFTSKFADL